MKVQIENNIYLESDAMQFILKEYTGNVDKHGTEMYKTLGYFTNPRFALEKFLKMKIMASTATTLRELQEDIESIRRYIESALPLELFQEAHREPVEVN